MVLKSKKKTGLEEIKKIIDSVPKEYRKLFNDFAAYLIRYNKKHPKRINLLLILKDRAKALKNIKSGKLDRFGIGVRAYSNKDVRDAVLHTWNVYFKKLKLKKIDGKGWYGYTLSKEVYEKYKKRAVKKETVVPEKVKRVIKTKKSSKEKLVMKKRAIHSIFTAFKGRLTSEFPGLLRHAEYWPLFDDIDKKEKEISKKIRGDISEERIMALLKEIKSMRFGIYEDKILMKIGKKEMWEGGKYPFKDLVDDFSNYVYKKLSI